MIIRPEINLQKAIGKIASRQALNDVHILIQLLRKAVESQPGQIYFKHRKNTWRIEHDGNAFHRDEFTVLAKLLNGKGSIEDIDLIEKRFGTTFLSCCVQFKNVQIRGKDGILLQQNGSWNTVPTPATAKTCGIQFTMHQKPKTDPAKELGFYGSTLPIPLYLNGKKLNRKRSIPPMILQSSWETEHGSGFVGIPEDSRDSLFYFYKRGVLFGVRHHTPSGGKALFGYWDSSHFKYERNFSSSIAQGLAILDEQGKHLYSQIPLFFNQFNKRQKEMVKNLLLQIPIRLWDDSLKNIPLFQRGTRRYALSLCEAKSMVGETLSLAYDIRSNKNDLPVLSAEDIYFLRRKEALPLRRILKG
jgi:hypothetical protein